MPIGILPSRNQLLDNDVATSQVNVVTTDAYITSVRIANDSGGALTFNLKDKASTPNIHYPTISVADNSVINEQLQNDPLFCEAGFDYVASGAGLDLQLVYYTRQA